MNKKKKRSKKRKTINNTFDILKTNLTLLNHCPEKWGNYNKTIAQTKVSIFPNPANTEVKVNIRNYTGKNITLRISDASGRQVYSNIHSAVKTNVNALISLSNLESGVYTIFIPELNYYYKLVLIK